ncbi:MAG: S-adenosylmethionine:tRNA ribosyltransferase-isomerase, partial [Candidatus Binataceae bacterium]
YELPPELIAQEPLAERDQARMLVVSRRATTFAHSRFYNDAGFRTFPGNNSALRVGQRQRIARPVVRRTGGSRAAPMNRIEFVGARRDAPVYAQR